jgi:hypothetical protein
MPAHGLDENRLRASSHAKFSLDQESPFLPEIAFSAGHQLVTNAKFNSSFGNRKRHGGEN